MLKIILLTGMVSIGILYAWVIHTLAKPFNNILIHCLLLGIGFGVINFLLTHWYLAKHAQLKRCNESLKSRVFVDNLTGLLNRRAFDLECEHLNRAVYSVLFIDIDNFRVFNNQHGHKIGDRVLQKVSKGIEATIRSGDKAYRFGGEEIIVLLENCDKKNAQRIAEKIRALVSLIDNHPYPSITLSVGIASCPTDGESIQDVLEKSDSALLIAKDLGKNRTVCI